MNTSPEPSPEPSAALPKNSKVWIIAERDYEVREEKPPNWIPWFFCQRHLDKPDDDS